MLITNATIISFKIPDDMELERNFIKSTEHLDEWVKSESSQYITYKKMVTYHVEGGIFNNDK